jgi:succinate dehydrogenase/fumarate reductase flavoprotein subunit
MATSLLTENGEQGRRVIGATGLHTRTGEFYIFKAKATIMSASAPEGLWVFSTETKGASTHGDPNNAGDSTAMAWRAGAEMALMERSSAESAAGGFAYPMFGVGNAANTWACCNIVDANGKEVPWVDRNGKILKTVEERYRLTEGQKMLFPGRRVSFDLWSPVLIPDLPERVKNGEYVLPLYADLPGMPPDERRAIWGLMIYNEGKTRILYENYQESGFDSDKDLLQAPVMPPDKYDYGAWWESNGPRQQRGGFLGGGLFFDWDMKTSLDGLYVAGESNYGGSDHALAAATGRYAARNAVSYTKTVKAIPISRGQIEKEKARIYAPVMRTEGMGWKELRGGLARIMQDHLGEYKSQETLELGLKWFKSARESELANVQARNPHELWRTVECMSRIDCGELMMHAALNRKASSRILAFNRLDFPQVDPKEWEKIVTVKLVNGEVHAGEHPVDYYLQAPNAPTFAENYRLHSGL